jgi:hypothetical protein
MHVYQLVNAQTTTENSLPHNFVPNAMSPTDSGNAAQTSVIKDLETSDIISA